MLKINGQNMILITKQSRDSSQGIGTSRPWKECKVVNSSEKSRQVANKINRTNHFTDAAA
jgi:hypothetical protein